MGGYSYNEKSLKLRLAGNNLNWRHRRLPGEIMTKDFEIVDGPTRPVPVYDMGWCDDCHCPRKIIAEGRGPGFCTPMSWENYECGHSYVSGDELED